MISRTIRAAVQVLLATGTCSIAHTAPISVADEVHSYHIPVEDASTAVQDFGVQARIAISAELRTLRERRFNAVSGELSIDAALRVLTAGSGIRVVYSANGRGVSLIDGGSGEQPYQSRPDVSVGSQQLSGKGGLTASVPLLEEIVVTAQRRAQRLQDVPLSAQVLEQQTLVQHNVNTLGDLSEMMPSIHVGPNSRSANLYIRGTGSGESQNFDQSVGVFSDDIYHGRARMSDVTFFDLDRIEVLKGPQSTFFGNNAIAGAFNIVTRKPADELEVSSRALYGEHGRYVAEAALGAPFTGAFLIRIAGISDGTTGWLWNDAIGRSVPGENNVGGRLTALFKPTGESEITFKAEGSKNRNIGALALQDGSCPPPAPFVASGFCKTALGLGVPVGVDRSHVAQNVGQEIKLDTSEYVLTANQHIGHDVLTSVTGYYNYHFNEKEDADGTPLSLLNIEAPENYHQLSEELRLSSPEGGRLEYMAGVYFHTDQMNFRHDNSYFFLTPTVAAARSFSTLLPYSPLGQDIAFSQSEHTYSVFAATTWRMAEKLSVSAGLRASRVEKTYDWNLSYGTAEAPYGNIAPLPEGQAPLAQAFANAAGLGVAGLLHGSRDDHAVMPSSQVQYAISSAGMAYFSYSKGWKAGGFNGSDTTGVAANLPFAPERVNAYEAGWKGAWLARQVLLNVDAFRSDYMGLQVTTNFGTPSGGILSLVRNAASSRSQGIELEAQWVATRDLKFSVEATYDASRYVDYRNVAPTQFQQRIGQKLQDLSGHPTEFAPDWNGTLAANYAVNLLEHFRLILDVAGIFSSGYFLTGNDDPTVEQKSYVRLDGTVSLESVDQHWVVDVIGKNLTNRNILTFGIVWPTALGSTWLQTEEPRNAAIQLRYQW